MRNNTPRRARCKGQLASLFERAWYHTDPAWLLPLRPLGWLVSHVASSRLNRFYQHRTQPPLPVLVVGNITVGGTGKTPFVIALAHALKQQGFSPGVISRGYGASPTHFPWPVTPDQAAREAGDEPLLIARQAQVPVVIDPHRKRALDYLVETTTVDVVISDDGLQHFQLPRSFEMVVLDSVRGLGNGRCLPAGPLREPATRLHEVDAVIYSGLGAVPDGAFHVWLNPADPVNLAQPEHTTHWAALREQNPTVHAVAGIANPTRFFDVLEQKGFEVIPHVFEDHHAYSEEDLLFDDAFPVLMTEKDAVKCTGLTRSARAPALYYVPVTMALPQPLLDKIMAILPERPASPISATSSDDSEH